MGNNKETITKTQGLTDLFDKASVVLESAPTLVELPDEKPIVFAGDIHGDYETMKEIINRYKKTHTFVFLGDYVDRPKKKYGSLYALALLSGFIANCPENVIPLRGNHEFIEVFYRNGLMSEISDFCNDDTEINILLGAINRLFGKMPYAATTGNGILALHGGIPDISSIDEIGKLPKDINSVIGMDGRHNRIISQIVWNDNIKDNVMKDNGGTMKSCRSSLGKEWMFSYGEPYFSTKMGAFEKKVLVRGHDYNLKGYSMGFKVLTIFTSKKYSEEGCMKGSYVAILDPQKEIKDARCLKIEYA